MNPSGNALILADYAIIVGFFVVMLAVGLYFAGRIRDAKDYFAGGKQVPWWLSSISFWMSSFSAFAFVAHSRLAYEHGCVPITMWWLGAVVTIITAHLVARASGRRFRCCFRRALDHRHAAVGPAGRVDPEPERRRKHARGGLRSRLPASITVLTTLLPAARIHFLHSRLVRKAEGA
ncbi:MAG: hypothetical protein ABIP48_04855 [Planctomycetota bacterium]